MVAAAVVGSAVVGGVAQASSAKSAASSQRQAAANANAEQQYYFDTAKGELQPFIDTGTGAASKISELEGINGGSPSSIQSTLEGLPGYQFANTQGLKSTQNSATARGLGISGAALKGAAAYSTGLSNEYYNNLLTGLQNTENTGAGAAGTLTGAATATGSQIGQNTIGAGNATAAGSLATGSAIGNAANGVPNGLLLNKLLNNNAGSDASTNFLQQINDGTFTPAGTPLSQGFGDGADTVFSGFG